MRPQHLFFCILITMTLSAGCTSSLLRGVDGTTLISTAHPPVALSVADLPFRTGGEVTASVTTGSSLGGIPVMTWLAAYGGNTVQSPLAIVAVAEAPGQWYWDSDTAPSFSIDVGTSFIGDHSFQTSTYIVEGTRDAFSSLVPVENPDTLRWIARRFAERTEFNQTKITLEYREPLPEDFAALDSLPLGGRAFLDAFEKRADAAFVVGVPAADKAQIHQGYPEGIRTRFINTNFLGTMSQHEPLGGI